MKINKINTYIIGRSYLIKKCYYKFISTELGKEVQISLN